MDSTTKELIETIGKDVLVNQLNNTIDGLKEKENEIKSIRDEYLRTKKAFSIAEKKYKKIGIPMTRKINKIKKNVDKIQKDMNTTEEVKIEINNNETV